MKRSPHPLFGRFWTGIGLLLATVMAARADYTNVVLNDHPIAYYPINSDVDPTGAVATDLSGNGNNGTYNSQSPQYNSVPGPSPYLPNALNFDGGSSYVDLGTGLNPSLLNYSGTITMEAWAQPKTPNVGSGTAADIIGKGYDGNYELCMRAQGGNYYGGIYNGNTYAASGGTETTNWTYLVTTYDGTNWNLYVNGALVQSNQGSVGAASFSAPWAIGVGSPSGNNRWFLGNICHVALYTNALSSSQVFAHYFAGEYGTTPSNSVPIITSQPTPQVSYVGGSATFNVSVLSVLSTTNQWYKNGNPITGQTNLTLVLTNIQTAGNYSVVIGNSNGTTNSVSASLTLSLPTPTVYESTVLNDQPIAYCPLEPSADTATTAYDWSGNGNNGAYNNSSSYNSGNSPAPHISNSANFNGSLSANLGGGPNAGLLNFGGHITLEAWVQPANVTGNLQDILAKGYDSSTYNETVLRQDSATYTGNGGSGGVAQVGTWAYVVSANDGTNWNLYVNGILVKQSASSSGATSFSDPWAIGSGTSGGSGRSFSGNLSQVALYNHGLSTSQVMTHYLIAESGATNVHPVIATPPMSQNGYVGGNAVFTVATVSFFATTNQWFWNNNPLPGQTNATLTITNLNLGSVGNYSVVVGNIYGTTNSTATLTVSVPNILVWSANNNNGTWDTATTANWSNVTTSAQTVFNAGDAVTFDDTVGVPTTATLGGTVQPSLITVNSSTNNFSIQRDGNGNGILNGSGSLIKKGTSTLTVNSGGTLTGTATIAGGLVYAGNNSFANLAAITITNSSTLDLGGGTFSGNKPITISGNGFNGQGAINDSYPYNNPSESFNITLAGDAKLGVSIRWDLASGSQISGAGNLAIDLNGGGYSQWNSVSVGSGIANITVTNGTLGSEGNDTAFQNPATLLTIDGNSTLHIYGNGWNSSTHVLSGGQVYLDGQAGDFNGTTLVLEDNTQWQSYYDSGDKFINSAITLNGIAHFVIGDHNMNYTNVISGPGGFVADNYNHAMVFSAVNTYTGPTIIGSGPSVNLNGNGSISYSSLIFFGGSSPTTLHLDASGRPDGTLTLASGQTLAGIGAINGNLVVSAGATVSPAGTNTTIGITTGSNVTGTIGVANNVTLNGTTIIKLNGSGTNDSIQTTGGSITYGGTLNLVNLGAALAVGNSFPIFTATNYSGNFTYNPPTPGSGLAWQLTSGTLSVVVAGSVPPVVNSTKVINGNLVLSGYGGVAGGTYYVLSSTNLTTPLASWTVASTNQYDSNGNFIVTNAITAGRPQQFYRLKQ